MVGTLVTLIVIFILVMLWLDGARARELAIGISKAACKKQGLQLLDDTVFLQRFGIRWTKQGLRFRRMFQFEYSADGVLRQPGYILLIGTYLETIHIQNINTINQSEDDVSVQEETQDTNTKNVIKFPDKKQ